MVGDSVPVIGMNKLGVVARNRALKFLPPPLKSKTEVVEQDAVGVKTLAIWSEYGNKLGYEIKDLPKPRFLFADFVFCPLAIFDVGKDAIPFDDFSASVTQRNITAPEPAVGPV